ncbi:ABC transporter substrate-binding protein [Viridibacillus sp. NPDC096237]|uniref:ABC transporter substrate-binding protein n=1 Tax=Viridibacillus sp. NPDC096237 TaxID=3390721 RepID=UPI003D01A898
MIDYMLKLAENYPTNEWQKTSVVEIAELFNCSPRYVKTIIKNLVQADLIEWQSFKGRGKLPLIFVKLDSKQVIKRKFDDYWEIGNYSKAYALLKEYELLGDQEVMKWIQKHFGMVHVDNKEKSLDVFRYPYPDTQLILDPLHTLSRHDVHFCEQLFEPLFLFDSDNQKVVPNIAIGYETNDGQNWHIFLRKDIHFHDDSILTSKDIVATFNRAAKQLSERVKLQSTSSINNFCVYVKLEESNYLFLRYLCSMKLAIVSHKWIEKGESGTPVGCGPFQLLAHTEDYMKLTVFPKYFGLRPWLDQVEIIHTPNEVSFGISREPSDSLKSSYKIEQSELGADFILLNATKNSILSNSELREWLYEKIHPESFCLYEIGETVAYSFLQENKINEITNRQVDKLEIDWPVIRIGVQQIRSNANHLREAEILEQQLNMLGIPCSLELADIFIKAEEVAEKYDCFVGGVALNKDKLISLMTLLQSNQFCFLAFLNVKAQIQVQKILKDIKAQSNEASQLDLYLQIEAILKRENVLKFLTHRKHWLYVSNDSPFTNIHMDAQGKLDYRRIYKKRTLSSVIEGD